MKLRPLQDRILVQRIEEEEKTKGGIIIPDTAKEKPAEGKVTAVGNGKLGEDGKRIKLEVKKGDRILFGKYSGTEVKIEGDGIFDHARRRRAWHHRITIKMEVKIRWLN
jgi:chaperonin GroES